MDGTVVCFGKIFFGVPSGCRRPHTVQETKKARLSTHLAFVFPVNVCQLIVPSAFLAFSAVWVLGANVNARFKWIDALFWSESFKQIMPR